MEPVIAIKVLRTILLAVILAGGAVACSPAEVSSGGGSALGTKTFRLPLFDETSGDYRMQEAKLFTFHDPENLKGEAAIIFVNPRFEQGAVRMESSMGRFVREGSRWTPADFVTLQAATIYSHFERLGEIDRALGIDKFMKYPARVALLAEVKAQASAPILLDNAIFDGQLDFLFFVPFTSRSKLPISLNSGIIAHEYFHRVFQMMFLNRLVDAARTGTVPYGWDGSVGCASHSGRLVNETEILEEPSPLLETKPLPAGRESSEIVPLKVFNQVLVRALNEGLADFWGWSYSQDDGFVGRSIGENENEIRRLDKPAGVWPLRSQLRNSLITVDRRGLPVLKSEGGRIAAAYRFGTDYARTLRMFVEVLESEASLSRVEAVHRVRKALALAIPEIAEVTVSQWGRSEIDPELLLKPILTELVETPASPLCGRLKKLSASWELQLGLCP